MAFDKNRCVTVLFGGSGPWGDTWEYDGTTWVQRCAECTPPMQRNCAAMACDDSSRGGVVLFGGWTGSQLLNDVWKWDGANWAQVVTTAGPSPRQAAIMAYDQQRDRFVLFGGITSPGSITPSDETWELDMSVSPAIWTLKTPTTVPPGREDAYMAYDPTLPGVVMFGGDSGDTCNAPPLADTWVYDGTNWSEVSSTVHPSRRMFHGLTFDETRNEIVLFGGSGHFANPEGYGDFSGETWAFGPRPAIPAVTEWGLLVMTLLIAVAGTLVCMRSARHRAQPT